MLHKNKKLLRIPQIIIFIILLTIIVTNNTLAVGLNNAATTVNNAANTIGYDTTQRDMPTVIGSLIKIILGIIGVLFLILVIISGLQWMTAEGNEDTIKKAKSRMKNAGIGLAITLLAYTITYFIIGILIDNGLNLLQ